MSLIFLPFTVHQLRFFSVPSGQLLKGTPETAFTQEICFLSPCTLELRRNRQAVDTAKFCRSQAHAAKVRSSVLNASTVSKSKQTKPCSTRNSKRALGSYNCQLRQKRTWEMNIFLNRWHLWCQILQPKHAKPQNHKMHADSAAKTPRRNSQVHRQTKKKAVKSLEPRVWRECKKPNEERFFCDPFRPRLKMSHSRVGCIPRNWSNICE